MAGIRKRITAILGALCTLSPLAASETDALAISSLIQTRHAPFGAILDPYFTSSSSEEIAGYTRCGDSALWTGAYLAAESFRYKVTRSGDALKNVKTTLAALKGLADVTGDNRLARCMAPIDWPYTAGMAREEFQHTVSGNAPWIWVDNTSRDQIVGAFFGLGVAYDLVDDVQVKQTVSDLATRLIGYISRHNWSPNDDITSTFRIRPEQLQMLLEVARHVNPSNTVSGPFFEAPMSSAVRVDVQSNDSYFKFNLDYMAFYHLVRLQNGGNLDTYQIVRKYTPAHQNAVFNMIDRALQGADTTRDTETRTLLDQWLQRPRRDLYVDLSKTVSVCGSEACQPVPVPLRPPTDFLWQRNPFQLAGGTGVIETAGIDYILPYWMARHYGVIAGNPIQSSAAPSSAVAPDSLASLYGTNLGGAVSLLVTDSAGIIRPATMIYISAGQVNFLVPTGTAAGTATFAVWNGTMTQTFTAEIASLVPRLYSMNGTGAGVAAATAVTQQQTPVAVFTCTSSGCVPTPIALTAEAPVYVSLYGTGIRNRKSQTGVLVEINGIAATVTYAGPSPQYAGLDQVNVLIPQSLKGAGEVSVILTADGQTSNVVTLSFQ